MYGQTLKEDVTISWKKEEWIEEGVKRWCDSKEDLDAEVRLASIVKTDKSERWQQTDELELRLAGLSWEYRHARKKGN